MPTISVYLNDEDYKYYKSLDKKAAVLRWAFEMHRKAHQKKTELTEPVYTSGEETA